MLKELMYQVYEKNCVNQEPITKLMQAIKAEGIAEDSEVLAAVEALEEYAFMSGFNMAIGASKELRGEEDEFLYKMEI